MWDTMFTQLKMYETKSWSMIASPHIKKNNTKSINSFDSSGLFLLIPIPQFMTVDYKDYKYIIKQ